MNKCNGKQINLGHFPDGTLLIKESVPSMDGVNLIWFYEKDEKFMALYF